MHGIHGIKIITAEQASVVLVREHCILYDWRVPGCTREDKIYFVWENIGKELN
jgi:hypothetical protein